MQFQRIALLMIIVVCGASNVLQASLCFAQLSENAAPSLADQTNAGPASLPAKTIRPSKIAPGSEVPPLGSLVKKSSQGFAYCLVVFCLGLAAYRKFYRKSSFAEASQQIEILSRRAISGKTSLVLVSVEGQKFLLSHTGEQISLISALFGEPEDTDAAAVYPNREETPFTPLFRKGVV